MRRYRLLLLLVFVVFMMTGCGANVTSELKFNKDGSGSRKVTAVISESDSKNLDDGFYELDELLESAAPEGVSLGRTMMENGDAKYEFVFNFDDIDDYNKKVKAITGKDHDATWYTNDSVFLSDITFKESQCTKDLIGWALDAFKDSKYSSFASNFTLYQVGDNEVFYNDELMYEGTKDPSFTVQNAAKLITTSMYSDYNQDGTYSKKFILQFEKGSLDKIDLNAAGKLLDQYTTKYKIDTANATITINLEGEEVNDFLKKADPSYDKSSFIFSNIQNIFQKRYEIAINYNLNKFLAQFSSEYPYIYDYIKLPEQMKSAQITHTNQGQDIKAAEGYDLAGIYRYDTDYEFTYHVNQVVNLKKVLVSYHITNDFAGDRTVKIYFDKNDCEITEAKVKEFYKDLKDTIEYADGDGESVISFISKFKLGDEVKNQYSEYSYEKLKRKNLKHVDYLFDESFQVTNYLPKIENYEWNLSRVSLNYDISIDKNAGMKKLLLNKKSYEPYQVAGKQGILPSDTNSAYLFQGSINAKEPLAISINFRTTDKMFYFWIILIIFLIVISGAGFAYYYFRKKQDKFQKNLEHYEDE
ncbi:hypothetical protein lbkm_2710 [Lachnospiraceae bacterium KM106-2]|nr:hypothetical protein lbkm_2710 [Lachnospiraceae bacterium KM106-2]